MNTPHISRLHVATAGLDLVSATRLKVASSLLMADRLDIRIEAYRAGQGLPLVAHDGSDEGARAIASARAEGTPWLAISRQPGAGDLTHGASVRDIADALRALLLAPSTQTDAAAETLPALPPFLEAIRLDQPGPDYQLLENGLLRAVADRDAGRLHLLRRTPLEQVLAAANTSYWRTRPLEASEWRDVHAREVTGNCALETAWWRGAQHIDPAVLRGERGAIGLAAWPDLEAATSDPQWLPVLAHLQRRDWTSTALAEATGIAAERVAQVMALVRLSGLTRPAGQAIAGRAARQPPAPEQLRSFLRIAKRFGLKLMGVQHG